MFVFTQKEGYANETVHTFFFGSREGVTISYPGVQVMDGYKVTERSWYRRALSNPGLIMSSPPYSDGFITNKRVVTFSKAVQLDDDEHTIIGVAGIDVAYDDIGSFIDNITSNGCMQDDVECFIIDKYGYLFYNSVSEEQTSLFLGASKGPLVKNLLKNGVITRKTKVTPFGECSSEEGGDESTDASTSDGEETSEACIGVETYYEMTDNIPAEGMSLDIFDTCMQGEYTVVQVAQTNLYMIVFRGHSGYCSDKNAVVPAFDPSEDYWCETYDEKTERYSGTCAHALERECVTTCPGEDDDDATMYCGGHGDCINGACVCDAGFEGEDGGCLVLDAASAHLPLTFAGLAIFLPFILSLI